MLKLSSFDPVFIDLAARSFSILSAPSIPPSTLPKKKTKPASMLTTKLLHAQKLWSFLLPLLLEGDIAAAGRARLPYLVAFASLLPLIPASMLLSGSSLPTLLPLLLRTLALPLADQRLNALLALSSMFELENKSTEADQALQKVGPELAEGLVRCALLSDETSPAEEGQGSSPVSFLCLLEPFLACRGRSKADCTQKVRAAALRCLAQYPNVMAADTVRRIKPEMLKSLGRALDDPLRTVRREAVECRAKWFLLK